MSLLSTSSQKIASELLDLRPKSSRDQMTIRKPQLPRVVDSTKTAAAHGISVAIPIQYSAHDGEDVYCKFDTLQDAVDGYWVFIDRPIYSGWRTSVATEADYIDSSPLRATWVETMRRNSTTSPR